MAFLFFKLQLVTLGCLYFSFDTPPCVWFIASFYVEVLMPCVLAKVIGVHA